MLFKKPLKLANQKKANYLPRHWLFYSSKRWLNINREKMLQQLGTLISYQIKFLTVNTFLEIDYLIILPVIISLMNVLALYWILHRHFNKQ